MPKGGLEHKSADMNFVSELLLEPSSGRPRYWGSFLVTAYFAFSQPSILLLMK